MDIVTYLSGFIGLFFSAGTLLFTSIQINKQIDENLFEKRLSSYGKVISIFNLWKENRKHFIASIDKDGIFGDNDMLFSLLTNTTYLYTICSVIDQKQRTNAIHQEFLKKLEDIEFESNILEFIYSKRKIKHIICFMICYKDLLMCMYQYQIVLDRVMDSNKTLKENGNPFNKDPLKENKELLFREKIFKNIDKLEKLYKKIIENKEIEYMKNTLKFVKDSNEEEQNENNPIQHTDSRSD